MDRLIKVAAGAVLSAGVAAMAAAQGDAGGDEQLASDRITFSDGRTLDATVLREDDEQVWVDLGFQVLAIPRADIASILYLDDTTGGSGAPAEGQLYSVATDPLASREPEDHAESLGAAVIKVSTPSGLGSGFIIHEDGYAITNAHVIQGETNIRATTFSQEGQQFSREVIEDIEIVAVNDAIDLALIKMEHPDGGTFPIVLLNNDDDLAVGEPVFAIGNPLGLERTLSRGVVSTTNRAFWGLAFVQTTTEINPGNSGGPLFNLKGEVVGCTNMGALFADGIGFAIPARYIRDFVQNHQAFAYDKDNPNSGIRYHEPPTRLDFGAPAALNDR